MYLEVSACGFNVLSSRWLRSGVNLAVVDSLKKKKPYIHPFIIVIISPLLQAVNWVCFRRTRVVVACARRSMWCAPMEVSGGGGDWSCVVGV